jgi:Mg-chelatase subunit ChlD
LQKEDFIIEEEGDSQEISFFTSEATPLKTAILMDVSSSMLGDRIARSQQAAIELLEEIIGEQDRAMILGFDHRLILYQTMTNDLARLTDAIRMTGPNG